MSALPSKADIGLYVLRANDQLLEQAYKPAQGLAL